MATKIVLHQKHVIIKHDGEMPTRTGRIQFSFEDMDRVFHEIQEWKELRRKVNTAGAGPKQIPRGWDWTSCAIWLSVQKGFDFNSSVPNFITHQVHVWVEPPLDIYPNKTLFGSKSVKPSLH